MTISQNFGAMTSLYEICNPKQWPTIPQSAFTESGFPVYGANGRIGYYSSFNHEKRTVLITCRGATCGTINVCEPNSYVTGNAMALDDLDESRVHLDYLVRALRQVGLRKAITGSAQPQITRQSLASISVPLPPVEEQRRIAEVLDRADELRAKRREALAHLGDVTQSIFLDLFGSPSSNPMNWPLVTLGDALVMPLRNGLSPATRGQVEGLVLTLSSVTGQRFDPTARKRATFLAPPPAVQTVHPSDFLICRGNGNLSLVGRGFFPYDPMPDTTFPDTIIAARIQTTTVRPAFLEHVWRSNAVRRQIEALARTTNGTYKVNQTMLESVSFFAPPLPLQDDFVRKIAAVDALRRRHSSHHAELDALFASLQDRAFRGLL
ncbi:restriction endonuclease subunit S [Micromonospora tulbaghiae]|uniref:restriction endonuclease subunit S n=1 Tax=Micromonospora tulbaghiae TaxID=479978 RepID=UPI0033C942E4